MNKIVGVLRPFDVQQTFYVYEDGNVLEEARSTVDDIPALLFTLIQKYGVTEVTLSGPKQYSKGVAKAFNKATETKFTKPIEIKYI